MAKLKIVTYPQKILKQKAEEISSDTPKLQRLVEQMTEAMYENEGIGLAGPQIGISKKIIIVETEKDKALAFLNPVITKKSRASTIQEEGCLSLPNVFVPIKRSEHIELECETPDGKKAKVEAGGLTARIFQHEIDHLNGKLIIDHLNLLKRFQIRKKLHGGAF